MLKLRLPIAVVLGLSAFACGSTETPTAGSGGRSGSGSGGSTSTGGAGGSTGGSAGGGAGGQSDSGTACPKFDYTNYNPTMSPTLKNEIQPIFGVSCALSSSCHQSGGTHHPFLGPSSFALDGGKPSDAMLQVILEELKKPTTQVAGRNLTVSGKPEESYIMNKIEGSNNCSGFVCMGPDKCGIQMPTPDTPLEKNQIEQIRAWIKKGMQL